jgi:hypothetical protein
MGPPTGAYQQVCEMRFHTLVHAVQLCAQALDVVADVRVQAFYICSVLV